MNELIISHIGGDFYYFRSYINHNNITLMIRDSTAILWYVMIIHTD